MMDKDQSQEIAYKAGDLVFAKVKGYPFWPAQISEPPVHLELPPKNKFLLFFGTRETAVVHVKTILPYNEENKAKYGQQRKREVFNIGMRELENNVHIEPSFAEEPAGTKKSSKNCEVPVVEVEENQRPTDSRLERELQVVCEKMDIDKISTETGIKMKETQYVKMMDEDQNEEIAYKVGDLVFAKVKGYSFWPAQISEPPVHLELPPKNKFLLFFGTRETAVVHVKAILPYNEENKAKYGQQRKREVFNIGMRELENNVHIEPSLLFQHPTPSWNDPRMPYTGPAVRATPNWTLTLCDS